MPVCPSCGSEFRAGFTECNTCRVPLVASTSGVGSNVDVSEAAGEESLQLLGTLEDDAQAMTVRRVLDDAGIPSVMQGGHASNIGGCVPYRILVDEDYLEAARETIAAFQSPGLVTGQIESALGRLSSELRQLGQQRKDLAPLVGNINETVEDLRAQLDEFNRELEE